MIYTKWGWCVCGDCGRQFFTPLGIHGQAAMDHQDCPVYLARKAAGLRRASGDADPRKGVIDREVALVDD